MLAAKKSENEIHKLKNPLIKKSSADEISTKIRVLVVDTDLNNLHQLKKTMEQYAYQVTVYLDAEEAVVFLLNNKDKIDLVIWSFEMPFINGIEALSMIGSKFGFPVVIISEDSRPQSVMKATNSGACDYLIKPVTRERIASLWKHVVTKNMTSKPGLNQTIESNPVQIYGLDQTIETDSVESYGLDEDEEQCKTIDEIENGSKLRISWAGELHQKFVDIIESLGGIEKAGPKQIFKCMQELKIEGLTRNKVASHLQKYRRDLEEIRVKTRFLLENPNYVDPFRSFAFSDPRNFITGLPNITQVSNPINYLNQQQQNNYFTMNNNQFMNSNPVIYLSNINQEPQNSYLQWSTSMIKKESEEDLTIDTNPELIYGPLPYDPTDY